MLTGPMVDARYIEEAVRLVMSVEGVTGVESHIVPIGFQPVELCKARARGAEKQHKCGSIMGSPFPIRTSRSLCEGCFGRPFRGSPMVRLKA